MGWIRIVVSFVVFWGTFCLLSGWTITPAVRLMVDSRDELAWMCWVFFGCSLLLTLMCLMSRRARFELGLCHAAVCLTAAVALTWESRFFIALLTAVPGLAVMVFGLMAHRGRSVQPATQGDALPESRPEGGSGARRLKAHASEFAVMSIMLVLGAGFLIGDRAAIKEAMLAEHLAGATDRDRAFILKCAPEDAFIARVYADNGLTLAQPPRRTTIRLTAEPGYPFAWNLDYDGGGLNSHGYRFLVLQWYGIRLKTYVGWWVS